MVDIFPMMVLKFPVQCTILYLLFNLYFNTVVRLHMKSLRFFHIK